MGGVTLNLRLAVLALLVGFAYPLAEWARFAATDELQSHLLLIPVVSVYLVVLRRRELVSTGETSPYWVACWGVAGCVAAGFYLSSTLWGYPLERAESLTFSTLAFVCGVLAVAGGAFGAKTLRPVAFPLGFLFCMVPIPRGVLDLFQRALQQSSAEVLSWLFALTRIPSSREGLIFHLPGLSIEVAQECSGVRSSLVLLFTCLVAGYFFLRSPWLRAMLVAAAIPLGILRNAFRIWILAELCLRVGPETLDSPVHHRGGPVFFVVSLVPLGLLIVALRRYEASLVPAKIDSHPLHPM